MSKHDTFIELILPPVLGGCQCAEVEPRTCNVCAVKQYRDGHMNPLRAALEGSGDVLGGVEDIAERVKSIMQDYGHTVHIGEVEVWVKWITKALSEAALKLSAERQQAEEEMCKAEAIIGSLNRRLDIRYRRTGELEAAKMKMAGDLTEICRDMEDNPKRDSVHWHHAIVEAMATEKDKGAEVPL